MATFFRQSYSVSSYGFNRFPNLYCSSFQIYFPFVFDRGYGGVRIFERKLQRSFSSTKHLGFWQTSGPFLAIPPSHLVFLSHPKLRFLETIILAPTSKESGCA